MTTWRQLQKLELAGGECFRISRQLFHKYRKHDLRGPEERVYETIMKAFGKQRSDFGEFQACEDEDFVFAVARDGVSSGILVRYLLTPEQLSGRPPEAKFEDEPPEDATPVPGEPSKPRGRRKKSRPSS